MAILRAGPFENQTSSPTQYQDQPGTADEYIIVLNCGDDCSSSNWQWKYYLAKTEGELGIGGAVPSPTESYEDHPVQSSLDFTETASFTSTRGIAKILVKFGYLATDAFTLKMDYSATANGDINNTVQFAVSGAATFSDSGSGSISGTAQTITLPASDASEFVVFTIQANARGTIPADANVSLRIYS